MTQTGNHPEQWRTKWNLFFSIQDIITTLTWASTNNRNVNPAWVLHSIENVSSTFILKFNHWNWNFIKFLVVLNIIGTWENMSDNFRKYCDSPLWMNELLPFRKFIKKNTAKLLIYLKTVSLLRHWYKPFTETNGKFHTRCIEWRHTGLIDYLVLEINKFRR